MITALTWLNGLALGYFLVLNGVYLAELVVTFDDGQSKRLLRKVAVVR